MKLECKKLNKNYGEFTAIKQLDFCFTEGVYGLLGPNGAGKSTWMKLLTANLEQSAGEICWNGKPIQALKQDYIKKIGYVPQNQSLFPYFTGEKFMYYMAALKGVSKKEAKEQIPRLLQKVNLSMTKEKKIGTYSGGMKQRLLIAQAFLGEPRIIFMDEPTSGLDPKERIRIRNLISEMSMHKIIIIATHVVSDVEFISKEILLLKRGEIIGCGSSDFLENKLEGMVYEKEVLAEELDSFLGTHLVVGIRKECSRILVRYLDSKGGKEGVEVRPNLDDVYLHYFQEETYAKV